MLNFNDANKQRSFEVIPDGTVATVHMTVKPGSAGEDGWLRRSKDGNSEGLDCEFTVVDGTFAKKKFWSLFTVAGTGPNHAQAGDITRSRLRAILESARGIMPDDTSEAAARARQAASYGDFDGLRFIVKIGVEPPQNGFKAKNTLAEIITPERKDWHHVEQVARQPTAAPTPSGSTAKAEPAKIERPSWAK
jgi:hypothetical protein